MGDDPSRVTENRYRAFRTMDLDPASMHDVWLVHGTGVIFADSPRRGEKPHQADIQFTDNPGVTLFMRFADCVPLLFHDPKKRVVGIAHAGWLGTLRGASAAAIQAMQEKYGSHPEDIRVGVGPSIGPDHYQVGAEVVSQFRGKFGTDCDRFMKTRDGSAYLDLWSANEFQLRQCGVGQIEQSGICTVCHPHDWFSHRAEKGKTGRFGALISLQV